MTDLDTSTEAEAGGAQAQAAGYHLMQVDSTQPLARAWAARPSLDAPAKVVAVLADRQSRGSGREGRQWLDGPGANMALSVGVRGPLAVEVLEDLAPRVARAVAAALSVRTGVGVSVELPNDLVVQGVKVGGVLVDARTTGGVVDELTFGVGVNLTGPQFDIEGRPATTMEASGGAVGFHARELADDVVPVVAGLVGAEVASVRWRQPARLWLALGPELAPPT